jgi:hypothetical protein
MPIGFAILSHLYKPLFLGRYLLPYSLGLIALAATGASLLTKRFAEKSPGTFAALLSLPLIVFVSYTVAEQYLDPVSNLASVLQLSQSMPTVIQDDGIVRQAHFYAPTKSKNLFYIMITPKPGQHATLYSIAEQGYEPDLVFDVPFFRRHPQFLYVKGPWQPRVFKEELSGNPHWTSRTVGSVTIRGWTLPVLLFTRVDKASPAASPNKKAGA